MRSKYEIALTEARKKTANFPKVLALLNGALDDGDPRAAYALATWYLHGTHVQKNLSKAVKLLRIAAKANIAEALYDLAVCYEDGGGVRKSLKRAYALYVAAALWGDRQSVYEVGRCLFYGLGTKQDRGLSRIWLDRAEALEKKQLAPKIDPFSKPRPS
jgi:uncharacterized protein